MGVIFGVLCVIAGIVWFFQSDNWLERIMVLAFLSFMIGGCGNMFK